MLRRKYFLNIEYKAGHQPRSDFWGYCLSKLGKILFLVQITFPFVEVEMWHMYHTSALNSHWPITTLFYNRLNFKWLDYISCYACDEKQNSIWTDPNKPNWLNQIDACHSGKVFFLLIFYICNLVSSLYIKTDQKIIPTEFNIFTL
jgi:hypothetical protein